MTFIDSAHIQSWAAKREAQDLLPLLIRKLIYASVKVESIDIPAGSSVVHQGWDGIVQTREEHPFVPLGLSVWEFGVDSDAKAKAEGDYNKRTTNPPQIAPSEATYIAVSPKAFTTNRDWANGKTRENIWLEVRAYNSSDLEAWLNMCPAVAKWFASIIGLHTSDNIESLESWWDSWSSVTERKILPEFVLSERQDSLEKFIDMCHDKTIIFSVEADSLDEGLAFIYSAFQSDELKIQLTPRAIIVRSKAAYDEMVNNYRNLFIIPVFPEYEGGNYALEKGHSIIVPVGRSKNFRGTYIDLKQQTKSGFTNALESMGYSHEEAWRITRDTKRSLSVFRRICAVGGIKSPEWLSYDNSMLICMMLIGAFDSKNPNDQEMVCTIFNKDLETIEEFLSETSKIQDPFVRNIRGVWELISFRDAWHFLSKEIKQGVLDRYFKAFLTIYLDENQKFLQEEGKGHLVFSDQQYKNSLYLRNALKNTSILLGIESRYQTGVDSLIKEIINENTSWQLWASLSNELPDFAEASPTSFLGGVAQLAKQPNKISELFKSNRDIFSQNHSMMGIIWGLERTVWLDRFGTNAVILFAKLAALDPEPDSNFVNRPINSLKEIFKSWHPQGNFTAEKRVELLIKIYSSDNAIGWQLFCKLLPIHGDIASGISKPLWRDFNLPEGVTNKNVYDFNEKLISLMISRMKISDSVVVIRRVDIIGQNSFIELVNALKEWQVDNISIDEKKAIWDSLEEYSARCERSEYEVVKKRSGTLKELADKFKPNDLVFMYAHLFGYGHRIRGRSPHDITSKQFEEKLEEEKTNALLDIFHSAGIQGIIKLASLAEDVNSIGRVLGNNILFYQSVDTYIFSKDDCLNQRNSIFGSYLRRRVMAEPDYLRNIVNHQSLSEEFKVTSLLCCYNVTNLFDMLESLSEESQKYFW